MEQEYVVGVGETKPFYKTLYHNLARQVYLILKDCGYERVYIGSQPALEVEQLRQEFSS